MMKICLHFRTELYLRKRNATSGWSRPLLHHQEKGGEGGTGRRENAGLEPRKSPSRSRGTCPPTLVVSPTAHQYVQQQKCKPLGCSLPLLVCRCLKYVHGRVTGRAPCTTAIYADRASEHIYIRGLCSCSVAVYSSILGYEHYVGKARAVV